MCTEILEGLLKFRKILIVDRLPSFLLQYRTLLKHLCKNSDTKLNLDIPKLQELSKCAHKMEKLTKTLIEFKKHIARISPYIICDFLKEYERCSFYTNIKVNKLFFLNEHFPTSLIFFFLVSSKYVHL